LNHDYLLRELERKVDRLSVEVSALRQKVRRLEVERE